MGYSGTAPTTRANGIAKPPPIATWAQRHSGGVCRGEAPSCRIGAVIKQKRANGLQFWGRRARGMAVECAVACTRARREHAPAVAFSAAPSSAAFVSPARHGGGGCGCASSCAMCSCTSCSAVRRSDVDQPPGLCLPAGRHSAGRPCAGPSGDVHSLETETETGQATYARRRMCRHTRCGVPDPDRLVITIRTRCSPRWARWRPPGPRLNGLAECGAVDLWKRCVDGGQAEGGAWGDRDRDRDRDRHRGGAGVGGERVACGDGWIEARPTPTSAPAPTRRHTQTRTRAHRETRPHGTTARPPPTVPPAPRALGSLPPSLPPSPFPNKKSNIG